MNPYIYLNLNELDAWQEYKSSPIFLRGNIIVKNLIKGQCFIKDETHKKFKEWVKKNYD